MCYCSKRRCDCNTGKQCFRVGNACSEGWGRDFGAGLLAHSRVSGHPSASPLRQLLGAVLPSLPGWPLPFSEVPNVPVKLGMKPAALQLRLTAALQEQEPARWHGDSPSQPPALHTTGSPPRTPRSRLSLRR